MLFLSVDDGVFTAHWRDSVTPVASFEALCDFAAECAREAGVDVDDLVVLCSSSVDYAAAGEGSPDVVAIARAVRD